MTLPTSSPIPPARFYPFVPIPCAAQRNPRRARRHVEGLGHPAPEKGKANKAVIELLAKKLGLKKSQIELIAGETSHQKRFLMRGVESDEVALRIHAMKQDGPSA